MTKSERAKANRRRRLAEAQIVRTILETTGGVCEIIDGRRVFEGRPMTGGDAA